MEDIIELKHLSIGVLRKAKDVFCAIQIHNPGGELFQHEASEIADENCLLLDIQSIGLLVKIYDLLKPENQAKFNGLLTDEYKLANFLDKMWSLVSTK